MSPSALYGDGNDSRLRLSGNPGSASHTARRSVRFSATLLWPTQRLSTPGFEPEPISAPKFVTGLYH